MAGCGEVGSRFNCDTIEGLLEACVSIIENAGLLRDFVNGDENTDVILGGKLTPSIRKIVQEILILKGQVIELLDQIINKVNEAYQLGHQESIVTLSPGIRANQTVTIPIKYIVGYNNLQISWEGMVLYRNHMYQEIGNIGKESNRVRYLIPIPLGKRIQYWSINSNIAMAVQEAMDRIEEATALLEYHIEALTIYTEHTLQTVANPSEIIHDGYYLIGSVPNVYQARSEVIRNAIGHRKAIND